MNIELKDIPAKLAELSQHLKKYSVFMALMLVLGMYAFLILRIQQLSTSQPTQTDVTNKLRELQAPILDEQALRKIEKLQSENVQVKSLFNQNRQNPFQE